MTIIEGVEYKKSMIFEVLGEYLGEVFDISSRNLFGSKILPSSCDKHPKFDYGCSSYSENSIPNFGRS